MRHRPFTQEPKPLEVGDEIIYDGQSAVVTEIGLPGEYGERVAISLKDGTEIITTPNLDHRWNRDQGDSLPTLTDLLHNPKASRMRRVLAQGRRTTAPHGRCANFTTCVEHAYDPTIPSCKKR